MNDAPTAPDQDTDAPPAQAGPRSRPRVAVVFGGRSGEHTISCATAAGVLSAIDRDRYEILPIGITKRGQWVLEVLHGVTRCLKIMLNTVLVWLPLLSR